MADITWGAAVDFTASKPYWNRCCEIDTDKFVVIGQVGAWGQAFVGVVSDTTISFGSGSTFCATTILGRTLALCKLDTNKFVVVYEDDGQDQDLFARVGTVTGDTIAWGDVVEIYDGDGEWVSCSPLGVDKFAACYNDEGAGDHGHVLVCTVSGTVTTPAPGGSVEFEDGQVNTCRSCQLDTDKLAVVYVDFSDGSHVKACVITVSGTVPSPGTPQEVYTAGGVSELDIAKLDTDKFVAIYYTPDDTYLSGRVGSVSGTTITFGTQNTIATTRGMEPGVCCPDATHFVTCYKDLDDGSYGKTVWCTVSGNNFTPGSPETFFSGDCGFTDICVIATDKVAVVWWDDDADDGTSRAGDTPAAPVGWTGEISGVTNPAKVMGVDVANIAKVKGVASA